MTEQFMTEILPQLLGIVGSIVTMFVIFMQSKLGKGITENVKNANAEKVFRWAASLAAELVLAVLQTTIKGLEVALSDGKITKEEFSRLKREAGVVAKQKLYEKTVGKFLSAGLVVDGAEARELASDLIESAVAKSKIANPT